MPYDPNYPDMEMDVDVDDPHGDLFHVEDQNIDDELAGFYDAQENIPGSPKDLRTQLPDLRPHVVTQPRPAPVDRPLSSTALPPASPLSLSTHPARHLAAPMAIASSSPQHASSVQSEQAVESSDGMDKLQIITSDLQPHDLGILKQPVTPAGQIPGPPVQRPPVVGASSHTAISNTTKVHVVDAPQKKRGRPVGWRPGMGPYSGTPSSSTPYVKPKPKPKPTDESRPRARPGRPPQSHTFKVRAVYEQLTPKFVTFHCEWHGCPAELQNYETLRKHVLVVHGRSEACKWGRCATRATALPQLTTGQMFESHMEKAHLKGLLWQAGDGPRNDADARDKVRAQLARADDAALPDYLFDNKGRMVTPSVRDQQIETEEDRKARGRRLRRLILERDRNAEPEELPVALGSDELERALLLLKPK